MVRINKKPVLWLVIAFSKERDEVVLGALTEDKQEGIEKTKKEVGPKYLIKEFLYDCNDNSDAIMINMDNWLINICGMTAEESQDSMIKIFQLLCDELAPK